MSVEVLSLDVERTLAVAREPSPQNSRRLLPEEITGRLLAAFFAVHRELGYGFADAVYAKALHLELAMRGVEAQSEIVVAAFYKGKKVGAYPVDFLVQGRMILMLRSGPELSELDRLQLLNCLRCSRLDVGMLLHFGPRPDFRRVLSRSSGDDG
ncbi:MAG: GxxExxY protein [Gemmatimonadaceae bacterium]